jgi:hypothetical protein
MQFKEVICVYSENHMKHVNALCEQNTECLNVTECGAFSYHCFKGMVFLTYVRLTM